jgi:hypothetical protein
MAGVDVLSETPDTVGWLATNSSTSVWEHSQSCSQRGQQVGKSAPVDIAKKLECVQHHVVVAAVRQMELGRSLLSPCTTALRR